MGYTTKSNNYVLGKNLATMEDISLANTTTFAKGSKVIDSGVYEITFSYSVRRSDTTNSGNPHFKIGFGTWTNNTNGTWTNETMVRLGADNTASQNYPNQREVTLWVTKTSDTELNFMCSETAATDKWWMYNINAVAKKIADI